MKKDVITKSVIVSFLNESIGLSKNECLSFFENFLEIISSELGKKSNVKIVNFGVFNIRNKKPRIGRNPKTKEEVMISQRNVVKFKPSSSLINQLNSNKN